jgi:hypothetical protein
MELRIELPVVAEDIATFEDHTSEACKSHNQKDDNLPDGRSRRSRMGEDRTDTGVGPKRQKKGRDCPEKKGPCITPRTRWRCRSGGVGLANSAMKRPGVGARSLLIEERDCHNIRGSALLTSIEVLLERSCHFVVPEPGDISR